MRLGIMCVPQVHDTPSLPCHQQNHIYMNGEAHLDMEFTVGDMVGVCHDQPDPLNVRTATAGSHSYMYLQWSSGPNQGNMLSIAYGNGVLPTDGSEHTAPQRTCPLLEVHVCEC